MCVSVSVCVLTWKSGDEESVKPSDPGCLIKGRAPGESWARVALKATSPNAVACVSGWALSCRTAHMGTEYKKLETNHRVNPYFCLHFLNILTRILNL